MPSDEVEHLLAYAAADKFNFNKFVTNPALRVAGKVDAYFEKKMRPKRPFRYAYYPYLSLRNRGALTRYKHHTPKGATQIRIGRLPGAEARAHQAQARAKRAAGALQWAYNKKFLSKRKGYNPAYNTTTMPRFTRKRKYRSRGRRSSYARRRRVKKRKYKKRSRIGRIIRGALPQTQLYSMHSLKQFTISTVAGDWGVIRINATNPLRPFNAVGMDLDNPNPFDGATMRVATASGHASSKYIDELHLFLPATNKAGSVTHTDQPTGFDQAFDYYDRGHVVNCTTKITILPGSGSEGDTVSRSIAGWAKGTYVKDSMCANHEFKDKWGNVTYNDVSRMVDSKMITRPQFIISGSNDAGISTMQTFTKTWNQKAFKRYVKKQSNTVADIDDVLEDNNFEFTQSAPPARSVSQYFVIGDMGLPAISYFRVWVKTSYLIEMRKSGENLTVPESVLT